MNAEIKKEWLAALRSGEYTQGRGQLRINKGGVIKHCCLGVLCEVANQHLTEKVGIQGSYPTEEILRVAGLTHFNPKVPFGSEKRIEYLSELMRGIFRLLKSRI